MRHERKKTTGEVRTEFDLPEPFPFRFLYFSSIIDIYLLAVDSKTSLSNLC